jgi:hypothetical protein
MMQPRDESARHAARGEGLAVGAPILAIGLPDIDAPMIDNAQLVNGVSTMEVLFLEGGTDTSESLLRALFKGEDKARAA